MAEGLFVVGLGLVLILIGLPGVAIRFFRPDMPKPHGHTRGVEIGTYIGMGLGTCWSSSGWEQS